MRPLRRAAIFRESLHDMSGGCRSAGLPPPYRRTGRKDRLGRTRYTDCEWRLHDGRVVVLEVDGCILVRCTTRELRHHPERVVADLIALGVTESSA